MADPVLQAAFWNYDRTQPLIDGRIQPKSCRLSVEVLRPEATFARAYTAPGFDLCELSFSNTVTALSQGRCPYRLLPVFLSRAFRHSTLFVRTDLGLTHPRQLRGLRVGLQEYDMTAAVVVRGLLRESGMEPADILWKVGEFERTKPLEFPLGHVPAGLKLEILPPGRTLEDRLLAGELDAMISLRVPNAFANGDPRIARLFPDPRQAEVDWYRRTGIFPIMHVVGVREDIAAAHPGLTRDLYDAFLRAKAWAVDELAIIQAPKVTLPWPHAALADARAIMGPDFWPYGISANRHTLQEQLDWSWEDGLQAHRVTLDEMFPDEFSDT